jgi:hypothetical protein
MQQSRKKTVWKTVPAFYGQNSPGKGNRAGPSWADPEGSARQLGNRVRRSSEPIMVRFPERSARRFSQKNNPESDKNLKICHVLL